MVGFPRHVLALERCLSSENARSAVLSFALAVCLAVAAGSAGAAQWVVEGRVVGVSDGDTITVLDAGKAQHIVRLGGIDAPERKQPFGSAAKEALSSVVSTAASRPGAGSGTAMGGKSARCSSGLGTSASR